MKEVICGIYEIKNTINNKRYIGSSIDVYRRWNQHKDLLENINKHENNYLQNSWNKYGKSNFIFRMIEEVFDESILLKREGFYVQKHKTLNREFGYNIAEIDENGRVRLSGATKRNLSKINKGENNPQWGKRYSHSDKTKEKISKALTGRVFSEEHLQNLSKALSGENSPWWGRKHSEETIKKMSVSALKRVRPNFDQTGEKNPQAKLTQKQVDEIKEKYIPYKCTMKMLAEEYGVSKTAIQQILEYKTWKKK